MVLPGLRDRLETPALLVLAAPRGIPDLPDLAGRMVLLVPLGRVVPLDLRALAALLGILVPLVPVERTGLRVLRVLLDPPDPKGLLARCLVFRSSRRLMTRLRRSTLRPQRHQDFNSCFRLV